MRYTMEYWYFLMYKRVASCAGRANIKNGAIPFQEPRRRISHRRGSWLACRREMLLKRQRIEPPWTAIGARDRAP